MSSYPIQEAAEHRGQEIRKRMLNPAMWEVRTWQNMGWHWQLTANNVCVNETCNAKFFALVSDNVSSVGSGLAAWGVEGSYTDPQEAVNVAVEAARKHVECLALPVSIAEATTKAAPPEVDTSGLERPEDPQILRLKASAFSNISYDREDRVEADYTRKDWAELTEEERSKYLDDYARDWMQDDIEYYAEAVDN